MAHFRTQLVWLGVAGTPWYLTIRTDGAVLGSDVFHDAVQEFAENYSAVMFNGISLTSDGIIERVEDDTENLISVEAGGSYSYQGGSNSDPLPYANQLLVRLGTNTIGTVPGGNPHIIKGKAYMPGLTEAQTDGGAYSTTVVNQMITLWNGLNSEVGLSVFSKGAGVTAPVTGVSAVQKPAVLRSRRD